MQSPENYKLENPAALLVGGMHLQPGMIIQVFKTEGNCNAVDTVNPFLGALSRQTSMLKHESTRLIGIFDGMPYPNQPRIQFHLFSRGPFAPLAKANCRLLFGKLLCLKANVWLRRVAGSKTRQQSVVFL